MELMLKYHGKPAPFFNAEMDVGPVLGSNNIPVVKTDVVVFKTNVTNAIFNGYKANESFTYETEDGSIGEVYFVSETEEVFAFSSHPKLL